VSTGVEVFTKGLHELGYSPVALEGRPDHIVIDYVILTGRFADQKVQIGFVVPGDFPMTPPSGPHVSPQIHPMVSGGTHPTGGIHASPFGGGWQYWSRPFQNWAQSKKTVAAYMSHVWRLWETQ
jgi:hypothetical protein